MAGVTSLSQVIDAKGIAYGTTPEGKEWCLKALHPAEPKVRINGVPDRTSIATVTMNYEQTNTLSAPKSLDGLWDANIQLLPHPVTFGNYRIPSPDNVFDGEFQNRALEGDTHSEKMATFHGQVERWRICYCGVTISLVCNDLNNQGSVVVAQRPYEPHCFSGSFMINGDTAVLLPKMRTFSGARAESSSDHADFEKASCYPNKYDGQAREGVYVPLKITDACEHWRSIADIEAWVARPKQNYPLPTIGRVAETGRGESPFPNLPLADFSSVMAVISAMTSPLCNGHIADICFRGLSTSASLRLVFRVGFEYQVCPTSAFVPNLRTSPPYDEVAMASYYAISRELKDAYPASYNDLGKLWSAVKQAARVVLPALMPALGPIGGMIAGGARMLLGEGKKKDQSAAQIERAQEEVHKKLSEPAAPAPAAPKEKKQRKRKPKGKKD